VSALDMLEAEFPHATPAGYQMGCRGNICSGRDVHGFSCSDAVTMYRGNFGFRRLVQAGASVEELAAFVAEERRAAVESDRADALARRRKVPSRPVVAERTESGRRSRRPWSAADVRRLREMHEGGATDSQIGAALDRHRKTVQTKRVSLGLGAVAGPGVRPS
jgi:hypothetical protein